MASFRAEHPFVRVVAFKAGFVALGPNRVFHPTLHGKKAQTAFHKVFQMAKMSPGVYWESTSGTPFGKLRFPKMPVLESKPALPAPKILVKPAPGVKASFTAKQAIAKFTNTNITTTNGCITRITIDTNDAVTAQRLLQVLSDSM